MKRYVINIASFNKGLTLVLPDLSFAKNRKIQVLGNLFEWLFYVSLPLIIFLLMLNKAFSNGAELSVLNFLIITISFLLFLFISKAILFGKKELFDPPFFFSVLIFALLTTLSSVLVSPASPYNTFGRGEVRLITGLSTLLLVIMFYLYRVYLSSNTSFKNIFKSLFVGFYAYLTLVALFGSSSFLLIELPTVIILSTFFIIYLFNSGRLKLFKVLTILILLAVFFSRLVINSTAWLAIGDTIFALFVSTLILDVILFLTNKQKIGNLISVNVKAFDTAIKEKKLVGARVLLRNLFINLMLLSPLFFLIILAVIEISGNYSMARVLSDLNDIPQAIKSLVDSSKTYFFSILAGTGFKDYQFGWPLFGNIIRMQGIIGTLAYIGLSLFAIRKFYQALVLNKFNNKVLISLGFLIIVVPVLSLVIYPTLFLVALWWLAFALLSYITNPDAIKSVEDKKVVMFRFKFNKGSILSVVLKLVLVLLVAISLWSLASLFLNVVKIY